MFTSLGGYLKRASLMAAAGREREVLKPRTHRIGGRKIFALVIATHVAHRHAHTKLYKATSGRRLPWLCFCGPCSPAVLEGRVSPAQPAPSLAILADYDSPDYDSPDLELLALRSSHTTGRTACKSSILFPMPSSVESLLVQVPWAWRCDQRGPRRVGQACHR